MLVEFSGKVHSVLPLASGVGQNGPWSRATVVFEVSAGQYTQKIACENTRAAEQFAKLAIGQQVHIKAELTSREYNGKWYTSLTCKDFNAESAPQPQTAPPTDDCPF